MQRQRDPNLMAMAEKILREIESILKKDVDEFVILPVTLNENKSPVVFVENNLGLEFWCVKHVYGYAYEKILAVRKLISKRKLLHRDYEDVNRLLIGAVLINPDVSTFWNIRREFMCDDFLTFESEFKLTRLVLSYKSKSNEAFGYRRWLVSRFLNKQTLDKSLLCPLLFDELTVCDLTAQKSMNNYHSWSHRTWCLENILKVACDELKHSTLMSELNYSECWITKHVSEHTGFYYRQFIINQVKKCRCNLDTKYEDCFKQFTGITKCIKSVDFLNDLFGTTQQIFNQFDVETFYTSLMLLIYELNLNLELNHLFMEHETLWYHRRFILYELFSLIYLYFGLSFTNSTNNLNILLANDKQENNLIDNAIMKSLVDEKCPKILKSERNCILSSKFYRLLIENEKSLIQKYLKFVNRQNYFAQRHEKWTVYILGIKLF